jgi:hypothetical protein
LITKENVSLIDTIVNGSVSLNDTIDDLAPALIALAQRLDNLVHHRRVVLSARAVTPGGAG